MAPFILMIGLWAGNAQILTAAEPVKSAGDKSGEIRGSMSLDTAARESGVPVSYLIDGLKLSKDVPRNVPLKELKDQYGFQMEAVRKLIADYKSPGSPPRAVSASQAQPEEGGEGAKKKGGVNLQLVLYGIFCFVTLFLLRGHKLSNRLGIWISAASVLIFGLLFRANTEPVRAIVQVFQALAMGRFSLEATLPIFFAFALMTFIGVKLVCGWGCPVGTLQELLYRLPLFNRIKKKRIPFWLSNSVRIALFVVFLILVFGWIFGVRDQSLYRFINPFKLFEWNFIFTAPIVMIILFGLSAIHYRIYCLWICPFGLFSWLIQDLSLFRVRIDKTTCLDCGKCIRACPTEAADGIYQGRTFKADCFSCARGLNACPNGSLQFAGPRRNAPLAKRKITQRT